MLRYENKRKRSEVEQGSTVCIDYEDIYIQERIQTLDVGCIPRSMNIILLNDLVDRCKV